MKNLARRISMLGAFGLAACGSDPVAPGPMTFEVTIENVFEHFALSSAGVFNTPVGAMDPGPLAAGNSYEFEFTAAPGSKLYFATMFVQSNDFFYAPNGDGIDLFTAGGAQVTGDVTAQVMLWDSGHEVNQEPGAGPDQAPRQAGGDTGAADDDTTVRMAPDTFNNLPATTDVIKVTLTSTGETSFKLAIENIAAATALMTAAGDNAPFLLAPGAWAVSKGDTDILFTSGQADGGSGLEALAEDGDPSDLLATLEALVGLTSPIAPGVWAVHTEPNPLFDGGSPDRGNGLEALAEDGNPASLASSLAGQGGVVEAGSFAVPTGGTGPAPAFPGESYSFQVTANPGDFLSFATMLVQSNDLFFAPVGQGISLFGNNNMPVTVDVTALVMLWDAGTEVNEEPGIGLNQAPRQAAGNTGVTENGNVQLVNDSFSYPDVPDMIRVTIRPIQ